MPSYIECVKDEAGGLDHPVVMHTHFFSPLARRAVGAIIAENKTDGLSCKVCNTEKKKHTEWDESCSADGHTATSVAGTVQTRCWADVGLATAPNTMTGGLDVPGIHTNDIRCKGGASLVAAMQSEHHERCTLVGGGQCLQMVSL